MTEFLIAVAIRAVLAAFIYWVGFRHGSAPIRRVQRKRSACIPAALARRQPRHVKTVDETPTVERQRRALAGQIERTLRHHE